MFDRRPVGLKPATKMTRIEYVSPSGLSTLEQCPRAYAISRTPENARNVHPDIRPDLPNYKMVFGSAFHKAVECDSDDLMPVVNDAIEQSGMNDNADGYGWDANYRNARDMAEGIANCLNVFRMSEASVPWAQRTKDTKIEQSYQCELDGMPVRGIVDMITQHGEVIDLKTTTKGFPKWHGTQAGMYRILAAENGVAVKDEAQIVKIFRPRKPDGASGVEQERLNGKLQERHIMRLVRKAKALRDEKEHWDIDYTRIANNPGSSQCAWCPAKGTSACPESRVW